MVETQREKVVSYLQSTFLISSRVAWPSPPPSDTAKATGAQSRYFNWLGICMLFLNDSYSDRPDHLDLFILLELKPFKTVQFE